MRKRRISYAVWLLLTACLYFFENNSGTRVILICSLLFPVIAFFRAAFFAEKTVIRKETASRHSVRTFDSREAEDPGDTRLYQPGDPVRRIHWKLSVKKDELLIRETGTAQERGEYEQDAAADDFKDGRTLRKHLLRASVGVTALCVLLLLLIPDARRGAQALCNRIFAASEAVNRYAYEYFPVPEGQSITSAVILTAALILSLAAAAVLLRSSAITLYIVAAITLGQVYFGLTFPDPVNIFLYGTFALWMIHGPVSRRATLIFVTFILTVFLSVTLLFPGVDAGTEAASETVRDQLSRMAQQWTGTIRELPEGETETRHVHTQSLQTGRNGGQPVREYRLVTVEEEQISMPRLINWLKMILLFLLAVALVVLPFAPFLLLNARKKKAEEARKAFASENVSEAVRAIFRQVILWLNETGHDAGNLLYQDWAEKLPADLPDGYADRFSACAGDFEEAAYSSHDLPEDKRQRALNLLKETEEALFHTTNWKQRLRIKYWVCLYE